MSAHDITSRLDHCRQVRDGEWLARCPAHDDKSPSLTIKDAGDGRTLIHCFAGCGAVDVVEALGLDMGALFPPTDRNYHAERKQREQTVDELVVEIAMADMRAGKPIKAEDRQRCREALLRLDSGKPSPDVERDSAARGCAAVGERQSKRAAERMAILRGQR